MKCPGVDTQYWTSHDIFNIECPHCKTKVEFFKDDSSRICSGCQNRVFNPRVKTDCLEYCKFASQCKELLKGN